jgi:hypothetical protein
VKKLLDAIDHATNDTLNFITNDLRGKALLHGWDPKVVQHISVNDDFKVTVPSRHGSAAFKHEYGSETSQPTGVIRKYDNSPHSAGNVFVANISRHMKGHL